MRLFSTNATLSERKTMTSRPSRITTSLTALATAALLTAGCISTEKTEYREAERVKVEFESDAAGRSFYEGLAKMQSRRNRSESRTDISIPVVFEHRHRVVEGENVAFNEAVRKCDTNADGKITETEARIFSEHMSKP
jgi:hypothetical protein